MSKRIPKVADVPKTAGIYKIVNLANGHCYIGQSKCLHSRAIMHFRTLEQNRHCNPYLQNAYNKYGRGVFCFEVLETPVKWIHLDDREQYFIELLRPAYNIVRNVYEGISCVKNDKAAMDYTELAHEDEMIKPYGWADEHRPRWHSKVYGGG